MTKLNISGSKQRQINAAITEIVTAKLATLDMAAGDRLIRSLAAFEESARPGIIAAIDEFSVDILPKTLRLTVDYGQSFDDMVAAGNYDWKNDDLTAKRFPIKGDGIVEFEARLFHFDRVIGSTDAIKAIEAADKTNPWSAAQTEHVLSFGTASPEEQRKYPVIGLGSVAEVDGDRRVPALWERRSRRDLSLYWFDSEWYEYYRFLAVRKVSAA